MSNIFKLCLTHFSRGAKNFLGGGSLPWLRAWHCASSADRIIPERKGFQILSITFNKMDDLFRLVSVLRMHYLLKWMAL